MTQSSASTTGYLCRAQKTSSYSLPNQQLVFYVFTRARGYKTFFVLNSAEHEISTAHRKLNAEKIIYFPA